MRRSTTRRHTAGNLNADSGRPDADTAAAACVLALCSRWCSDSKDMDEYFDGTAIVAPLGKLKILPPSEWRRGRACFTRLRGALTRCAPEKARKESSDASEAITDPFGVIHTQHVKYNATTRSYEVQLGAVSLLCCHG